MIPEYGYKQGIQSKTTIYSCQAQREIKKAFATADIYVCTLQVFYRLLDSTTLLTLPTIYYGGSDSYLGAIE